MNYFLRVILVCMAMTAFLLAMWVATPSSVFYNPTEIKLDGETITLMRDTPYGQVQINWIGEITLVNQDNFECAGYGKRIAQTEETNMVTAKIGSWAIPCIAAGAPFVLRYEYQVMLGGIIPLRPVGITVQLDKEEVGG